MDEARSGSVSEAPAKVASATLALLAAGMMSSALAPLNSTMIAVALDSIRETFPVAQGWLRHLLVTSYLMTSIVLQSPGGSLGDRVGHRRALGIGQALFATGAVIAMATPVLAGLALARVTMAAGGAIMVPSAPALLRTELPAEVRGRAFGTFGATMALAAATGPLLGGLLTRSFGWTSIFLANVPVLLVAFVLARSGPRAAPSTEKKATQPYDLLGTVLLGLALAALVGALEGRGAFRAAAAASSVVATVAFVAWERRAPQPVIDLELLRHPTFLAGGLVIALQNLAMYSLLFELPQVLHRVFGLDSKDTGKVLVTMMATMVVTSPIAGRVTEKLGARRTAVTGSLVGTLGIVVFLVVPLTGTTAAILPLVLIGLSIGFSSAPAQTMAMSSVPVRKSGMAAGVLATMRYLGGIAGIAILSLVLTSEENATVALAEHETALFLFLAAFAASVACAATLVHRPQDAEGRT